MAALDIPASGLSLRGWPVEPIRSSSKDSTFKRSAVLLRINKEVIRELQQCSRTGEAVRLLSGRAPKLLYSGRSVGIHVEAESHTHEVYSRNDTDPGGLDFTAAVIQRANLSNVDKVQQITAGTDAALANLKQSLASFAQDKEAKQATISSSVIPSTKSNKILSSRYIPNTSRNVSQGASPLHGSSKPTLAPTSAPASDPTAAASNKAMMFAMSHLLSFVPLTDDDVFQRTHIPQPARLEILKKIAEQDSVSQKWSLKDKNFKELDIWTFKYPSEAEREAAIDNAIRAFDRMRLSKDDKLWQHLLPKSERGKGRCLSRLHNNIHLATIKEKPSHLGASSPLAATDSEHLGSNAGRLTPQPSSASVARSTSATGKPVSIEKRLKESHKHRAAEETKEAKKKAQNLNTPPSTIKVAPAAKTTSRFKSSETVHSSDDGSSDEMALITGKEKNAMLRAKYSAQSPRGLAANDGRLTKFGAATPKTLNNTKVLASSGMSSKRDAGQRPLAIKGNVTPTPAAGSSRAKAVVGKDTPAQPTEKRTAAKPAASSTSTSPVSRAADNKPKTPSPLGQGSAVAPSLFGNFNPQQQVVKKVVGGGATKGHKPSTSVSSTDRSDLSKARPAAQAPRDTDRPRKTVQPNSQSEHIRDKAQPVKKGAPAVGKSVTSEVSLKRKANDISSGALDNNAGSIKHRRTESSSTRSVALSSSSANSHTTTARTSVSSPSPPGHQAWLGRSPSANSSGSEAGKSSWERALEDADRFRNTLYPRYLALYDKIDAMKGEAKREDQEALWKMHATLKEMKREINNAAQV